MQHLVTVVIQWVEIAALFYFIALNSLYLIFSIFAYGVLVRHRRRWTPRHLSAIMRSPATPAVSIVVPAYNERTGIVDTVRSLLMLNYPQFEVIVVNDGSTDDTLTVLRETFGLVEAPCNHASEVATQPVRAIYRSLAIREIVVIDKANGGKADATNAGLNAARFPLMCLIDADSVLEEHALTRAVLPFIENPTTVAVGGIVRIGNGCVIDQGRVTDVRAPRGLLARFQIIEYLRSFLAARVTQSAINSLLIVSGAFGVFKRDVVIEAGGWRTDTVGEDMEIIVRLHRFCRENRRPYRVVFQPDPVVWTEAPETLAVLSRQRNRWQRGTLQVLGAHATMFGRPRYGRIGLIALPYYAIFEGIGPIVELIGVLNTVLGLAFGLIDWRVAELFIMAAILYGTMISVASVLLEELSFRRYLRMLDVCRLLTAAVLENFGYRQLTTWWRLQGSIDYWKGRQHWGAMVRKGMSTS